MPDHPMSDEERVAELEQQLSAAYDYWSNRVARLEAALGPQLTAEEIAEARALVADLLVAAPDKAERHLRLIDAILAHDHIEAAFLRYTADREPGLHTRALRGGEET